MKARLKSRQTRAGEQIITLVTNDIAGSDKMFNGIAQEEEIDVSISKAKKKRSLTANAYYHVLCRKVCDAAGIEMTRYHNRNLAEIGVVRMTEKGTPDFTLKPEHFDWEAELNNHYKPLPNSRREIKHNGKTTYWEGYVSVLGSSEYNSQQMALLIDHVIEDAREMNIETLPKHELEMLIGEWEKRKE